VSGSVVLGGLLGVVAGVLAVGGAAKVRDPRATSPMLQALGLPSRAVLARLLGLVEVVVGAGAFFLGGPVWGGLVAALFIGFTVAVLRLRAVGDDSVSCGCFGRSSAPPTLVHAAVDGVAAAVALAAAVTSAPGFLEVRPDLPAAGVPHLLLTMLAVGLGVALLTVLPEALVAARRAPSSSPAARPIRTFSVEAPLR
jgi:hypothetical protein